MTINNDSFSKNHYLLRSYVVKYTTNRRTPGNEVEVNFYGLIFRNDI